MIEGWLAEAREAWPGLTGGEPRFVARAREALEGGDTLFAADLYLACACAAGDEDAIRRFDEHIVPQVLAAVRRIDAAPAFVDEVVQSSRDRLLVGDGEKPPRIAGFGGRGPLVAWVRVAAVRIALEMQRRRRREVPLSEIAVAAAADLDPELAHLKRRYAGELETAFREACAALSERARAVLRLNFGEGLNIEQIGAIYGVHRATVARWIAAARQQLFRDTGKRLRARLALTATELDSLVRLVRSQIDVNLSQIFPATDS